MPKHDATTPDEPIAPSTGRLSFMRFLRDIIILLTIGGVGLYFYRQNVLTRQRVEDLSNQARIASKRNDLASLQKSEQLFLEALKEGTDEARISSALAETYIFQHVMFGLPTQDKAITLLDFASRRDIQSPTFHAVKAYLDIIRGKPERAEAYIRDLLKQNKTAPQLMHALGWALMEQHKHTEATRFLKSAVDSDARAVAYRMTLAETASRRGLKKAAIKHLSGILRSSINPDHDLARAYSAVLRLQTYGDLATPTQLLEDLDRSKRPRSPRTEALIHWAKAERWLALGQTQEAIDELSKAREKWEKHPPLLGTLARIFLAEGKEQKAITTYVQAVWLSPAFRSLRWDLARLHSQRGDDTALSLLDGLEKTDSDHSSKYQLFRGRFALNKGELAKARNHFSHAISVDDSPEALLGLAQVAFAEEKSRGDKADLSKVAEPLQKAINKVSVYPEAHEFYGDIGLWSLSPSQANTAYEEVESQLKRLNRPIPEVKAFYNRVIEKLKAINTRSIRREARKLAATWEQKRQAYAQALTL